MELKLELIAKDYRGAMWRILFPDNREALLFFTKAGFYRGGHFHSTPETSLILSGKVRNWKIVDDVEVVSEKGAGEIMSNQPGEPHLTLALEDYWLLDWKVNTHIGESTTTNYEPYRRHVTEQLAKHKEASEK